jgi:hypothetical protein
MAHTKSRRRAAPVVQMLIGLRQQGQPATQSHGSRATIEDFEREQLGVAAKE